MKISEVISPVTDIKKVFESFTELKEDKQSFNSGDISLLAYDKKKKEHILNITKNAAPLAITCLSIALLSSLKVHDIYQNGSNLQEYFSHLFIPMSDPLKELTNSIKDFDSKQFFSNDILEYSKNYLTDVTTSVFDFCKNFYKHNINTKMILSTISSYALLRGAVKTLDYLSLSTPNLRSNRDYDTENLKIELLKKHIKDPVLHSLNNEEIYATMLTFNQSLQDFYKNKNVLLHKATRFVSSFGNVIVSKFRKTFNSSTNGKNQLINSSIDYLNKDIDIDNLSLTFKNYGISKQEFDVIASKSDRVTKIEKIDYIFNINDKALKSAYNLKLKDDAMLSFSLTLETFTNSEKDSIEYKNSLNKLKEFNTFISGFGFNKSIFGELKTPPELRMMNQIINKISNNQETDIAQVYNNPIYKKHTLFLEENAPHLITNNNNSYELNNFTFLNYFEAEKERLVKTDLLNRKLEESEVILSYTSKNKEPSKYNHLIERVNEIQNEVRELNYLTKRNGSHPFINKTDTRLSSISKNDNIKSNVSVINFLSKREEEMISGKGLNDLGDKIKLDLNTQHSKKHKFKK